MFKSTTAIPNPIIKNYIRNWHKPDSIYSDMILDKFKSKFVDWVTSSKYNTLSGLEVYKSISYVHGTLQAFDHFYLIQKKKRFRFFKDECSYHERSFKHDWNWKYIEDDEIKNGDAVILSVPFIGSGKQHELLTEDFLNYCDANSIPMCLDFSYLPLTKNININLNHRCIQLICFSLSKAFYGMANMRVGIKMVNEYRTLDEGITFFNEHQLVNRYGAALGYDLMNEFSVDYNWDTFGENYSKVCKENNLIETDCVLLGINENDKKTCISNLLV